MSNPLITPVTWGRISESHTKILIIGSGPSLTGLDPQTVVHAQQNGVYVIAVNDAAKAFPSANAWFTLDPHNLFGRMHPIAGQQWFVAIPDDFGIPTARWGLKDPPPPQATYLHRLVGNGVLNCKFGLSDDPSAIYTGNSAYGALGVAYLMKAKKVALLGVDGSVGYFYDSRPINGNLAHLPVLFKSALSQLTKAKIKVFNGSPLSIVDCFPRMSPIKAIENLLS